MKIDVEKLINLVSRYPPIYNPDNKDFNNKNIRDKIFSTVISKEMNGIKGEILNRKWDKILNKYASFIRKLSNDDSSEKVLERFMEWPWTRHMRIFKPYVRKQFQIPEFQPSVQILEMNPEDLPPDIPRSLLRPELMYVENVLRTSIGSEINVDNNQSIIHNIIVSMMGLDQPSDNEDMDTDENNDTDDEIDTDEESNYEKSNAEKINQEESFENTDYNITEQKNNCNTNKNDKNVLPDLPQPEAVVKGSSDFTSQELTFLAWAKTMSTFTVKRQATVKTKISEIMSEAEFEDLDDEFFGGN